MRHMHKLCGLVVVIPLLVGLVLSARPSPRQAAIGFHLSGRYLLDANGNNLAMRGISHAHTWYPSQTGAFADIVNASANTVRVVLSGERWTKNDASDVANVVQAATAVGSSIWIWSPPSILPGEPPGARASSPAPTACSRHRRRLRSTAAATLVSPT